MKKYILFFLVCKIALLFSCKSDVESIRSEAPKLHNKIISSVYILDEKNMWQYQKVTFFDNGKIEGLVIRGFSETKWGILREDNGKINRNAILIGGNEEHFDGILFLDPEQNKSDYRGKYLPYMNKVNVLKFGGSHGDEYLAYVIDPKIIQGLQSQNVQKEIGNNSIIEGIEKEQVYEIKTDDDLKSFISSYFNNKENTKIFNQYKNEDEFKYNEEKNSFSKIRNKKFVLWKFKKICALPEYDFEKKSYIFSDSLDGIGIDINTPSRSLDNEFHKNPDKFIDCLVYSEPLIVKIEPNIAKELKDKIRLPRRFLLTSSINRLNAIERYLNYSVDNYLSNNDQGFELIVLYQVIGIKFIKQRNRKCLRRESIGNNNYCSEFEDGNANIKRVVLKPLKYSFTYKEYIYKSY